jgi:hypothetical protein
MYSTNVITFTFFDDNISANKSLIRWSSVLCKMFFFESVIPLLTGVFPHFVEVPENVKSD